MRKKLDFTVDEKIPRIRRRSKYGIKNPIKELKKQAEAEASYQT